MKQQVPGSSPVPRCQTARHSIFINPSFAPVLCLLASSQKKQQFVRQKHHHAVSLWNTAIMIYVRTLIASLLLLPLAEAHATDWRFAGNVDNIDASYFDADGIQYPDKDTVRVWVKYISVNTINRYFESNHRKQVIDDTAKKIASGYIPNYVALEPVQRTLPSDPNQKEDKLRNILAEVISGEVIANKAVVHATSAIFYEIDCKGKRIGLLEYIKYRTYGSIEKSQSLERPQYDSIKPDSSGEWLSMLVCPKS